MIVGSSVRGDKSLYGTVIVFCSLTSTAIAHSCHKTHTIGSEVTFL